MPDAAGDGAALRSVRVIDLADERAIYGSKLLADLGADVVRVEPPGGDPLRLRGPFAGDDAGSRDRGERSLWYAYFATNRRFATIDTDSEEGRRRLEALCRSADIVIDTGILEASGVDRNALLRAHPALVLVEVSSFGDEGPWKDYLAPDLVAGALGGFCATTGDVDTPPLKGFGDLNFIASGTYAAIAALSGLWHARHTGEGQGISVPVHEAVVSCLEHVLMWLWYHERIPMAEANFLPRRGSLHWSNAYQVMQARGGSIMITPTPDAQKQIAWLVEEGVHGDLLDERYQQPENALEAMERLMQLLREWVATQDVEPFFFEAQRRHYPFGWVLRPDRVAGNPQLAARSWWTSYDVGDAAVRGPGAPYHLSETPWQITRTPAASGADTESVLRDIGWE